MKTKTILNILTHGVCGACIVVGALLMALGHSDVAAYIALANCLFQVGMLVGTLLAARRDAEWDAEAEARCVEREAEGQVVGIFYIPSNNDDLDDEVAQDDDRDGN